MSLIIVSVVVSRIEDCIDFFVILFVFQIRGELPWPIEAERSREKISEPFNRY